MKSRLIFQFITILAFLLLTNKSKAHCEIPCGIYGDSLRVQLLFEHIETIEKSMNQIKLLTSEGEKNNNQMVRWVLNKEEHSNEIQNIVSQYFLHQRVKIKDITDDKAYSKYTIQLVLLHKMLVYSMKAKQTTDILYVDKLSETLKEFSDIYFHGHSH